MNRVKSLNENVFNEINDEKSAYFLGLIYADGNLSKNKNYNSWSLSVCQSEKDFDIIIKFKKFLETDRKITEIKIKNKKYYTISINSKKICSNLIKFGAVSNKSLVLKFPDFIDENLMPHFIRGYFDGDGSVWEGKRKKMIVKNDHKKNGVRERIVHNVKFNFTGSNTFIPYLQEYLVEHIGLHKTKLSYSKSKKLHKHCSMEYSGRKNMKKLYDYLYNSATIYGKRKKEKFKKILGNENNCE